MICFISVEISYELPNMGVSYADAKFNWTYTPAGLYPFDPAYNNYTVLLDGHSHTDYSDGSLTPEQNILWHIANGYNAMILSDHNDATGGQVTHQIARAKYGNQIKVLVAQEYTCCRIHMNLVGINATIPSVAWPTDEQFQQVINLTHAEGGFVSVNHIPWSLNAPLEDIPTVEQLYSWGVDYIEVVNQNTFDYQDFRFATAHGMGAITGTDMHHPERGVNAWTTLIPANFSEEAIFEELKARRTSFIYNAIDTPYGAYPTVTTFNLALDPFYKIGGMLANYYYFSQGMPSFNHSFCQKKYVLFIAWNEIGVMIGWLGGCFILFEVLRQLIQEGCLRFKRRKIRRSSYAEIVPLMDRNSEYQMTS